MDKRYRFTWVYSKVSHLADISHLRYVPMPETSTILISHHIKWFLDGNETQFWGVYGQSIWAAAGRFNYPVFVRTDLTSSKYKFIETCFVDTPSIMKGNIRQLLKDHVAICDQPPTLLIVRKYIEPQASFTTLMGLPIGKERVYIVNDGEVESHSPYWTEDKIKYNISPTIETQWRARLSVLNEERGEVSHIKRLAENIGRCLLSEYQEPYFDNPVSRWALKFMLSASGIWYFIDATPLFE